jgi:hypothetical protein
VIAAFSLMRYPRERVREAVSRIGLDRPALRGVPGLRFVRLLGTGRGQGFDLAADLGRWAMFSVWEDEGALRRFEAVSPVARRHRDWSVERYVVVCAPVRCLGSWSGRRPLPPGGGDASPGEPLAVLTRAAVRPWRLPAFWSEAASTGAELAVSPGLLASIGIGEAPVVRQATFSLWRSAAAMGAFAACPAHRRAVARRRAERWYSEEMFARLRPLRAEGTWDGRDPLAGLLASG